MATPIVATGIQPSGSPHIGNYLGAIRPALDLATRAQSYIFVVDYHALTSLTNPRDLNRFTHEVAATWLAMGLDPSTTVLYRQSDVPALFELSWLFACLAPKGMLNRAHAYKAFVQQNQEKGNPDIDAGVNMGLYTYPLLMAADILLPQATLVPVGKDQAQHVEMTRDIALRFNNFYGEILTIPEPYINDDVATVIGTDGRKMSKSYGNTIPLFAPSDELRSIIRRFKTDSSAADAPKDPNTSGLFQIYRELAEPTNVARIADQMRDGSITWSALKDLVFETLDAFLVEPRKRYDAIMSDTAEIERILTDGGAKAREHGERILSPVRRAMGRS